MFSVTKPQLKIFLLSINIKQFFFKMRLRQLQPALQQSGRFGEALSFDPREAVGGNNVSLFYFKLFHSKQHIKMGMVWVEEV
jgi:hypothetical protein